MAGKRVLMAIAVAGTVVLGGGAAYATASGTTIKACYKKSNGALRLALGGTCGKGEKAISWSRSPSGGGGTGPAGPQGPKGDPGKNGVSGLVKRQSDVKLISKGSGTLTVGCQSGEVATGGGFQVYAGNFNVHVVQSMPTGTPPDGWQVAVVNPGPGDSGVIAWVLCAKPS